MTQVLNCCKADCKSAIPVASSTAVVVGSDEVVVDVALEYTLEGFQAPVPYNVPSTTVESASPKTAVAAAISAFFLLTCFGKYRFGDVGAGDRGVGPCSGSAQGEEAFFLSRGVSISLHKNDRLGNINIFKFAVAKPGIFDKAFPTLTRVYWRNLKIKIDHIREEMA
jgi:hypothetical protein